MSAATAPWSASWIAADPRRGPDAPSETLTGSAGTGRFAWTLFRTAVELAQAPAAVPTRVSGDSRYVLWVNGHEVGRGPARAQPYRQRYDEHDLAPFLVVGQNVVAVLVTYYGRARSFWQPAPAGSSPDAFLVLEADLGDRLLLSDETWRVARPAAWALLAGHNGGEGVPVEICDARRSRRAGSSPGSTTRAERRSRWSAPPTRRASAGPHRRPTRSAVCARAGSPRSAGSW